MTKVIIAAVALGIFSGYTFIPDAFIAVSGDILVIGLCILLFLIGIDMGIDGKLVESFKAVGAKILVFPIATLIGTFGGAALACLVLPFSLQDTLAVGAGLGWYTLAPLLLADYSMQVSAVSFLHCVMRELFGIILIPIVAKRIGCIECTCLTGAAAMDVSLTVVDKSTRGEITIYSFISGAVLTVIVPIIVPIIASI